MKFDIITIFPNIFDSYLKETFIEKAQSKKLIAVRVHNLRDFTKDNHKTVDEKPYGGGLGMVLKVEPIYKAVNFIKKSKGKSDKKTKVIVFTPRGKQFNQKMAHDLLKADRIIMICGRYEGIDERVGKKIADLELSIGPFDLMGGELPAMVVMETMARLIPGVLGKPSFLKERIVKNKGFMEYPQYTRPEEFFPSSEKNKSKKVNAWKVPKVLVSGNHKEIENWRKKYGKII